MKIEAKICKNSKRILGVLRVEAVETMSVSNTLKHTKEARMCEVLTHPSIPGLSG